MKVSIVMPVFNEAATISEIIRRVKDVTLDLDKEIIIVDDGSTDGTRELLKSYSSDSSLKIFYHSMNMGKTAAIRTALKNITGDIVIIQDSDLEYNPSDYDKLLKPIISKQAGVVYGSRFISLSIYLTIQQHFLERFLGRRYEYKIHSLIHFFAILLFNSMAFLLYGIRLTDIATGYKVFRSDIIKGIPLRTNRFEFCYEITAKLAKRNISILEVPIEEYTPRSISEGKKIRWNDGVWAIWSLLKYRFVD